MIELADDNFDEEIIKKKDVLCLVDFWAPWCNPCKMMESVLTNIKDKFGDKLFIGKYDVEKGHSIAGSYGVNSLPTLILFKYGKVAWVQTGLIAQSKIENKINEYL